MCRRDCNLSPRGRSFIKADVLTQSGANHGFQFIYATYLPRYLFVKTLMGQDIIVTVSDLDT